MSTVPAAVRLIGIRDTPLSIDEVFAAVRDPAAGGVCLFVGVVRDHDGSRDVTALEYSSHPSAADRLTEVATAVSTVDDVIAVAAVHRVGPLAVGDLAVVCAVAAGHRPAAFAACRRFIDELKDQVPVWKHETFLDGDATWVGL
ncbi:molybdenum cofactor biosynthesis protein MoaE [Aeromicrobium marinum]|uniref:molybdenum cofactor biosynthesis protein MoaE n=1 Tax=Aeromicrobium marinum TaxID=219314 RepID=UPI001FDF789A|nr:molybdenum cofactor biosynthesis protein MoaE [Aeromicrobium marinum]